MLNERTKLEHNPINLRRYHLTVEKRVFKNIRRGIFEEGRDALGGGNFVDPPPMFQKGLDGSRFSDFLINIHEIILNNLINCSFNL